MIIGVDLGNYATKTSKGVNFTSKVAKTDNILDSSIALTTMDGTFYMEEGSYNTEYRKIKKEYIKEMFLAAVAMSTDEINNQICVGLPLSQYKEDKNAFKELLLKDRMQNIGLNGIERKLIIEDIEVYPEGIAALINKEFNGVIVDIGGRTTDIALLENKKVKKPYSLPIGTLNLYSDFIKMVNSKYALDLKADDAPRLIKNGLKIYGEDRNIGFALDIFKSYVEGLVNELQVGYSIKTLDIMLVGGGAIMLHKAFKNRIPNVQLIEDSIFANSRGFKKRGESIWL
ncbi:MAG TPA: ParM/StbA family protein [Clostridiaceae bacterium]